MDQINKLLWKDRWDLNYKHHYQGEIHLPAETKDFHPWFPEFLFPVWRKLNKNDDVLEIGCGTGNKIETVFSKVNSIKGMDISESAVNVAKERFKACSDVSFDFNTSISGNYDLIYCLSVFQHIPKEFTKEYIKSAFDCLKSGGALFFNVIYGVSSMNYAIITTAEKCEPTIEFLEEEIKSYCREAGFTDISLFDYVSRGYMVICKKP